MNARQLGNLAYTLIVAGMNPEERAEFDKRLYDGAMEWEGD